MRQKGACGLPNRQCQFARVARSASGTSLLRKHRFRKNIQQAYTQCPCEQQRLSICDATDLSFDLGDGALVDVPSQPGAASGQHRGFHDAANLVPTIDTARASQ